MPIFNTYPVASGVGPEDTFLIWQKSTNLVKQVSHGTIDNTYNAQSVQALRDLDVSIFVTGDCVTVSGYYGLGDGGGGDFVYSSTSSAVDNGGTIFNPTVGGGAWLRIYTSFISVDWFGAKGDGSTDDAAAIALALDALPDSGLLSFNGEKTYLTKTGVNITNNAITLDGNGCTITSDLAVNWKKFYLNGNRNCTIKNFNFKCLAVTGADFAPGVVNVIESFGSRIEGCSFDSIYGCGVYVYGTSEATTVIHNIFTNCFLGVFSDDDGSGHRPISTHIINNSFSRGLGTTSTSFSGAIKFSGTGTIASICNHVISSNSITGCGEMGIEIQSMVNDVAITGNTISLVGYGISVSGCNRVSVSGNSVKDCSTYGIELASSANHVSVSGNSVTSSTRTHVGIAISSFSAHVSVTGNVLLGWDTAIAMDQATYCTIESNVMKLAGGSIMLIKSTQIVSVTGNTMVGDGSTANFFFLDSTNASVERINISGNTLSGSVTNNGITLYSTANTIEDVSVSDNNVAGAVCPGGLWSGGGSSSPITRLLRIRSLNNIGNGTGGFQTSLNMPSYSVSTNTAFFYEYYYFEQSIIYVNAVAGDLGYQLPDATGLGGWEITITKSDSSSNNVMVTSYNNRTIAGSLSYVINNQYSYVKVRSDGTNWAIVSQRTATYASALRSQPSAISLTNNTQATVLTLPLPPGEWDVEGSLIFGYTGATTTGATGFVYPNLSPALDGSEVVSGFALTTSSAGNGITIPRRKMTVTTTPTTNVYLLAQCSFSAGAVTAAGSITARRV